MARFSTHFLAIIFLCVSLGLRTSAIGRYYRNNKPLPAVGDDVGDPLILTTYIEDGDIEGGQQAALVEGLFDFTSYAGFFTVNATCNSNLFFWFFPATEVDPADVPLLLWLQGGPGASSIFAIFSEIGPVVLPTNESLDTAVREYSWNSYYSIIYIDNPTGTGYSFADDTACYARNEDDVARDLYSTLVQFFQLFPDYQDNDFFVTGESYAGKYVPSITLKIIEENPTADVVINLKGMAIGDGLSDPFTMVNYGDFLYNVGMVDAYQRKQFKLMENRIQQYIFEENWSAAFAVFDETLNGDLTPYSTLYKNSTGFDNYFSYLLPVEPADDSYYSWYVQQDTVRTAIHVGATEFTEGDLVEEIILDDIMQSVKPRVEAILTNGNYKVMFYNGQMDVIVGHTLTENFLRNLFWDGVEEFANTPRRRWRTRVTTSDGDTSWEIAGWRKTVGVLTYTVVRNAGHMVPYDQPQYALAMIRDFIDDAITTTTTLPFTRNTNIAAATTEAAAGTSGAPAQGSTAAAATTVKAATTTVTTTTVQSVTSTTPAAATTTHTSTTPAGASLVAISHLAFIVLPLFACVFQMLH